MERKYSIAEIDRMRRCISYSYPPNVPYYEQERAADIENRLRTYMMNGTEPEELEQSMREVLKAQVELTQRMTQPKSD